MFKKLIIIAISLVLMLSAFVGCLSSPQGDEEDFYIDGSAYQRPEFIETRPDYVVESYTLREDGTKGKPPKPTDPVDVGGDTDPNPNPANKYAYIVGISDYEGTQNDLQYCDDDAIDWRNYLLSQGFTVRMDLDRNATSTNIQAGLTWLMNITQPGDEIVFAYSGHGDKNTQYGSCLISTDLYYLTNGWVAQFIQGANCSKKFVAVDACFAGSFQSIGGVNSLCSTASNTTYSYDGTASMQNGVWTYYFMDAVNNKGMVFGEDATEWAETKMKEWARLARVRVSPGHIDNYTGKFDF